MALPSAQLGGLASLNVPSYVPTQVVQAKEPLWKKALAQVLMSTAASAGQGVAQNATARDYAPDAQKAGFWDKLVSGPKQGEREHLQGAAHEQALERIGAEIVGRLQGEDLNATNQAGRDLFQANANLESQGINNEATLRRDYQDRLARIEEQRQGKEFTANENVANREFQGRQDTERNALLREQTKELAGKNSQTEMFMQQMKDALAAKNAVVAPQTAAEVERARQTQATTPTQRGVLTASQGPGYVRSTDYAPPSAMETFNEHFAGAVPEQERMGSDPTQVANRSILIQMQLLKEKMSQYPANSPAQAMLSKQIEDLATQLRR